MRRKALILLAFLLMLYLVPAIPAHGEGWLTGWSDRDVITVLGSSGAGNNYTVHIAVSYDAAMKTDFADIRFTGDDGVTELNYWLETYTASTSAEFWVKVENDLGSNQIIYMYYGNSSVSTTSDGPATFLFFDDFEDSSFDLSLWSVLSSGGSYSEANGFLTVTGPQTERIQSDYQWGVGNALCLYGYNMTVSSANKYLYGGGYDIVTPRQAILQEYGVDHRYATYNGVSAQTTPATNYVGLHDYEIQLISGSKFEYFKDGVSAAVHSTYSFADEDIPFDFEVSGSSAGASDKIMIDTAFVRKVIDIEPRAVFGDWNIIDEPAELWFDMPSWNFIVTAIIEFMMEMDPTAIYSLLVLLGLIIVPASTLYLVKGGREELTNDKFFLFLIAFMVGWALIIGGIM